MHLELPFSSSANTLVSNVSDATRKKNSLTFSPVNSAKKQNKTHNHEGISALITRTATMFHFYSFNLTCREKDIGTKQLNGNL